MLRCVPSFLKTTIGGCIATATHSSGIDCNSLSDYVTAMKIVDASGELHTLEAAGSPYELRLAACHLGALGVVVEVTLRAEPRALWHVASNLLPLSEAMDRKLLAKKVRENEFYRFWWVPHTNACYESYGRRVVDSADAPSAANSVNRSGVRSTVRSELPSITGPAVGDRVTHGDAVDQWRRQQQRLGARLSRAVKGNWLRHNVVESSLLLSCRYPALQPLINHAYRAIFLGAAEEQYGSTRETFTFDCLFKQWANEWAVHADKAVDALEAVRRSIEEHKLRVHFPVEFRFCAADGSAMSPAFSRPTCWVGIVMYRPHLREAPSTRLYYDDFCARMTALGGRPHWAKYYNWSTEDMQRAYGSNWEEFRALRAKMDPNGMFVNGWLETLLSTQPRNSTQFFASKL